MPSPFPGMDPYIEQPTLWPDFHHGLAEAIAARLNPVIRPRYVARLEEYVAYEVIDPPESRRVQPDLSVWRRRPGGGEAGVAVAPVSPPPVESFVPWEIPTRWLRVEIREIASRQVVGVIEILSPVNKRPGQEAREEYLRKRRDLLRTFIHFLEIDLLRGGDRPPLERPVPPAPYYITLSRAERRPIVEVWPVRLDQKLPIVPVPLREPDPDAPLDLGAAVVAVYERGAYADEIDYRQPPPPPPFGPEEARWVEDLLRTQR